MLIEFAKCASLCVVDIKSSKNRVPEYKLVEEHQPWHLSKAQMESYVDLLAPRILEVWDIEDEPEWGRSKRKCLREQLFPEQVDKVEAWLSSIPNSKCAKQEKKMTSHRRTPCKDKEPRPVSTSTPYEHRSNHMLEMDMCVSQFPQPSDFEVTFNQSKKQKVVPKEEYILGF